MARDEACYLYAVTAAGPGPDLPKLSGVTGAGDGPAPVHGLPVGSIAAIFSVVPTDRVRPDRRNLAAHQGVLRAILDSEVPFLPASFGLVAPSRRALVDLLRSNRAAITAELGRLAGKVEMTLKAAWDVANLFEYFVFACPELARLRDRFATRPGGPSRDEKIEMGRTFESMRSEVRKRHSAQVMRVLRPCVAEFRERPVRDENAVMDLACLVERGRVKAYERAVLEAASLFDDNYAFDYGGPWPPFSFVGVSLEEPLSVARCQAGEG